MTPPTSILAAAARPLDRRLGGAAGLSWMRSLDFMAIPSPARMQRSYRARRRDRSLERRHLAGPRGKTAV
jgi:hypothetical protein